MGRAKLWLPFQSSTFLGELIKAYRGLGCHRIIVVFSGDLEALTEYEAQAEFIRNPNPQDGPLSSIKLGLSLLPPTNPGYYIHPVDHPAVKDETLTALLEALKTDPKAIIKPIFDGRGGHPILLSSFWRNELLALPPSASLRTLLAAHADKLVKLSVADPAVLLNVNTPSDYNNLLKLYPSPDSSDS